MKRIDLHVHTTASDGTCTPTEVVHLAKEKGLAAIAITDHDTVAGYDEAAKAGEELGIEVVPGIEISTRYLGPVHILGYYLDPDSAGLTEVSSWLVKDRDRRNERIVALMRADGLDVDYERMRERFGAVIGRPHFAKMLVEMGIAQSINDAFARFVERGQKYYVARNFLPIERSIRLIRESGGVPVMAHPFQYKLNDAQLRELIGLCIKNGLMGMECRYSGYSEEQCRYLLSLAKEYALIPTGGSDFHGSVKPHIALGDGTGGLCVPYRFLQGVKAMAGIEPTLAEEE